MKTWIENDKAGVAARGADVFVQAAQQAIERKKKFVVALAGGTTPVAMHELLAQEPRRNQIAWERLWVVFGDERAVPAEHLESNYGSAMKALLSHVPVDPTRVLRIPAERDDIENVAREYEIALSSLFASRTDLLCLGVGRDGHIFSLYPGAHAIESQDRTVVSLRNPPMNPARSRISFTPRMLEHATQIMVLASGRDKAEALKRSLEGNEAPSQCPARLLATRDNVTWILDRDAASLLKS